MVRVAVVVIEGEEVFTSGVIDTIRVQLSTQDGTAQGS